MGKAVRGSGRHCQARRWIPLARLALFGAAMLAGWPGCAGGPADADRPGRPGEPASQPADRPSRQARVVTATRPDDPPAPTTAPSLERIVEADRLFARALADFGRIGNDGAGQQQAHEALRGFLEVLRLYPQSDKAPDAYFYAAEVLSERLEQYAAAAAYYQRAYQTDPRTAYPARFKRASVLDFRLRRYAEAVEEYRNVLRFEVDANNPRSVLCAEFAATRIRQLTPEP